MTSNMRESGGGGGWMSVWEGGNNNRRSTERQRAQLGVEDEYGGMCEEQKDPEEEKNKHMTKEEEVGENERDKKITMERCRGFPHRLLLRRILPEQASGTSIRSTAGPHVEHRFRERSKVTSPTQNMDAFIYFKL